MKLGRFNSNVLLWRRMLSVVNFQEILYSTKELRQTVSVEKEGNSHKLPTIVCKNEKFNQYKGRTYGKFDVVPLASGGWHHHKSKGDYFEIRNYGDIPVIAGGENYTFQSLHIPDDIIQVLSDIGITQPSSIQVDGIKQILKGKNTLLAAETGSGKTFAYLLPIISKICHYRNNIHRDEMNSPFGIIVTPSRELADQIGENAKLFAEKIGINVKVITGGHTKRMIMSPQFSDVDLLISSIGALNKLIYSGIYRVTHAKHIVLDEADTLFDDSFNSKLVHFLRRFSFLPETAIDVQIKKPRAQITMASATIPTSMRELLADVLPVDTLHRVDSKHLHCILPHVPQHFMRLSKAQKPAMLLKIAKTDIQQTLLIFSNKSSTCDWISLFLNENGVKCTRLNGDMPTRDRLGKFQEFQSGTANVLSCTDMGSRGLDTVRVNHVLNYDFPLYMVDYIHRCGRTGRIGSPKNSHITHFVSGSLEIELVQKIELAVRKGEPLPNVNANIRRIIERRHGPV